MLFLWQEDVSLGLEDASSMARLEDNLEGPGHAGDTRHMVLWWQPALHLRQDLVFVQQA